MRRAGRSSPPSRCGARSARALPSTTPPCGVSVCRTRSASVPSLSPPASWWSSCARPPRAAPPARWLARCKRQARSGPGRLQEAIRAALDDPEARVLFRRPHNSGWLDIGGRAADPYPERSITTVAAGTAIEHDAVLDDDPTVVEAVAAVAALALETERLRALPRAQDSDARPATALEDVLTDREREVLALAADGLTDVAIAQRLYVTRRTVETHLGHIFTKLDMPAGNAHNRRVSAVRRYLDARQPSAEQYRPCASAAAQHRDPPRWAGPEPITATETGLQRA